MAVESSAVMAKEIEAEKTKIERCMMKVVIYYKS